MSLRALKSIACKSLRVLGALRFAPGHNNKKKKERKGEAKWVFFALR